MRHIFNIGLSRAGTSSLHSALKMLGYNTLHHRYNGRRLPEIIRENEKEGKRLFDGLEHIDGFLDFSGWNHYEKLDRQYPGSLFIFTYRELYSWMESQRRWNEQKHGRKIDKARLMDLYNSAVREIWNYFRGRDDLLIINIPKGEGWGKLCPFFGHSIPNEPFPHKNQSI